MKGKFTRKAVLCCWAIRLGLACLLLTGTALAGPGDLEGATTNVDEANCATDVQTADQVYTMGVPRTTAQSFIIRYTLNLGEFDETPAVPTVGSGGSASATVGFRSGGVGEDTVEYDVIITTNFVVGDTLTLTAPVVRFTLPIGNNTTMTLTVDLRDGGEVDPGGNKTVDLVVLTIGSLSVIAIDTELLMAAALRSEETVVARLERLLSRAETIAELRSRDVDSMLADLFDALTAIVIVNDGLDSPEANQCLGAGVVSLTRADMSAASVLDTYVGTRLEDPSSEVTLQTLLNLMGRAIEHKEDAMETLISVGFF